MASRKTVTEAIRNAVNPKGKFDINLLDYEAIRTVVRAYGSRAKPYNMLMSKTDVAKYFGTTVTTITKIVDYAFSHFGVVPYKDLEAVIKQAAGNQIRHANQSLSSSENKYYKLLDKRNLDLLSTWHEYLSDFDNFAKTYLNGTASMIETVRSFGLSICEGEFILVAEAATRMTDREVELFVPKFLKDFYDYSGPCCNDEYEFITTFRKHGDVKVALEELVSLRHTIGADAEKRRNDLTEFLTARFYGEYFFIADTFVEE